MSKQLLCKTFAKLCESYVAEVSTSLNLVKGKQGGPEIIKFLHQNNALAHDQDYRPVDKISWSELKDSYRGAWAIVIGSTGVGAIKAAGGNTGSYDAVALDPQTGEIRRLNDGRGGNIMDFFKPLIGKPVKYFVGRNTTAVTDKQRKRAELQAKPGTDVSQDTIIKKFKPLWVKAMVAATADIKGMAANMIKNDAYEKAEKKISILKSLESAIEGVESGSSDTPNWIKQAVGSAIYMAASHYYPEQTGEIQRPRYGGGYSSERSEGPQLLLKDIAAGDTTKLGTILAFFKRSLISG